MGEFNKRPQISSQSVTRAKAPQSAPPLHLACIAAAAALMVARLPPRARMRDENAQLSLFRSTGGGIIPAYAFVSYELPSASESLTKTAAGARGVAAASAGAATTQHQTNRVRVRARLLWHGNGRVHAANATNGGFDAQNKEFTSAAPQEFPILTAE